jgi:hypothetical protein
MSKKKKPCKCKKHGKKKCPKCFKFGSYYFTGKPSKRELKMLCKMVHDGINVYNLQGKPGGCPPGGC